MKYLIIEVPEANSNEDIVSLAAVMSEFPMRWWTSSALMMSTIENISLLKETLEADACSANFDKELRTDIVMALADTQILLGEEEVRSDAVVGDSDSQGN